MSYIDRYVGRLEYFGISDSMFLLSSELINYWIYITMRNTL